MPAGVLGDRAEVGVVRPHAAELVGEVDEVGDVEALVDDEVVEQLGDQARQVQELARLEQLADHRPEELLLPADPGEVRDAVARLVPRPDVRERRRAVERLAARLDVQPRELVLHRVRDAHPHPAERVDEPLEPRERHVQDVVDLHAGDLRDRSRDPRGAEPR